MLAKDVKKLFLDCECCTEDNGAGITVRYHDGYVLLAGGSFAQDAGHNLELPARTPQYL